MEFSQKCQGRTNAAMAPLWLQMSEFVTIAILSRRGRMRQGRVSSRSRRRGRRKSTGEGESLRIEEEKEDEEEEDGSRWWAQAVTLGYSVVCFSTRKRWDQGSMRQMAW